jgi:NAD+ kinase
VRLARVHEAPFTDRLVAKFDLPVLGWRGAAERKRNGNGNDGGNGNGANGNGQQEI